MVYRLSQLARHLSRPSQTALSRPAVALSFSKMTSSLTNGPAGPYGNRSIHTAGCIIIGDEVLGGKVSNSSLRFERSPRSRN